MQLAKRVHLILGELHCGTQLSSLWCFLVSGRTGWSDWGPYQLVAVAGLWKDGKIWFTLSINCRKLTPSQRWLCECKVHRHVVFLHHLGVLRSYIFMLIRWRPSQGSPEHLENWYCSSFLHVGTALDHGCTIHINLNLIVWWMNENYDYGNNHQKPSDRTNENTFVNVQRRASPLPDYAIRKCRFI